MADTLFASPAFILTETSFAIVASIAAYELLVGDLKQQNGAAARRASSAHDRRGRDAAEGYSALESRSLSPGGRAGGGRGQRPGPRRASTEETPLMYPSRARAGGNRDDRISEEGYYSSPGDTRFASPGRGSSGDTTRRLFYKFILLALLSRFALLPLETYCLSPANDTFDPYPELLQIILRLCQTLPDMIFASALGLLVIFCAKIAFAAMPPLSPEPTEGSLLGDDAGTLEDGATEEGGSKVQDDASSITQRNVARRCCVSAARLSRTVLASKKTFAVWNIVLFISYTVVFVTAVFIPHAPVSMCEIALWIFMAGIYTFLLISLAYVAVLLGKALHPGIVRRKSSDSLALRLVWTCILLAIMFVDRVVSFSLVAHRAIANFDGDYEERIRIGYLRSTIEYSISESLPVLIILFMMHRKRKEVQSDVLIINNLFDRMNNLFAPFGSMGRLNASESSQAEAPSAGGEGGDRGGGGLGSRRFQSYGGTRVDSFPPSSGPGNKARRNIPRAVSSSGAASKLKYHVTQHPSATDPSPRK